MSEPNATFHSFTSDNIWFATGRGIVPSEIFSGPMSSMRRALIKANNGKYPETTDSSNKLTFVVIPDKECTFGHPLLLRPNSR